MDKLLLSNLIGSEIKHTPSEDFDDGMGGRVKVYVVEGQKTKCKVWNSSNGSSFSRKEVCSEIAKRYLADEDLCEGRVDDNMNEIMFEISEK